MLTNRTLANAIRFLSIDAIQKANSGHPGMPLGMADIATVLWREFLNHNPNNPRWSNRDRFILSNGHGSMLQYSLLHLTGYDLPLDELKNFRQLHSKTPGHPEVGLTPGVETTTGPLAQGLANAVGMALAEKILAAQFNQPNFKIIDHYTYVFVGDGCLMEGLSHEVCSLAGTLNLGKLIAFWDDNGISIDGHTSGWFTEDIPKRFEAYGWHVVQNVDGYDEKSIRNAILEARAVADKPTMICCKTIIGFGAPNMCGIHDCHGSPLGDKEIQATRDNLRWSHPPFQVDQEIYAAFNAKEQGAHKEAEWQKLFNTYQQEYPDLAKELLRRLATKLPPDFTARAEAHLTKVNSEPKDLATRQASQKCLEFFGPILPELLGGAADLTPSVLTNWSGSKVISNNFVDGNYVHYGVREFGMLAMMNGIALHGGFIPYGGTFLAFLSYSHSAVRMAALMKIRSIAIFTHDSIGLGEDGPTHQPIEQLAMLRATPNVSTWRPCDDVETMVAWQAAIENMAGPTCLVLSRQKLPHMLHTQESLSNIKCGGYILINCLGEPEGIVIATGSEVHVAAQAVRDLQSQGKKIRLVSMPSTDAFDRQSAEYRETVLPGKVVKRVAVEAGATNCWYKYVGIQGKVLGIDRFGESAKAEDIFKFLGFTADNIANLISHIK